VRIDEQLTHLKEVPLGLPQLWVWGSLLTAITWMWMENQLGTVLKSFIECNNTECNSRMCLCLGLKDSKNKKNILMKFSCLKLLHNVSSNAHSLWDFCSQMVELLPHFHQLVSWIHWSNIFSAFALWPWFSSQHKVFERFYVQSNQPHLNKWKRNE